MQSMLLRSARTVRHFLEDTVENVVRAAATWAKGVAILYAVGAALILVALVALANGLAWAVVELGLPPYAAWLILSGVAGGVGYGLFKRGAKKGIVRSSGGVDERPGLSVRIVRKSPRRRRPVFDVHKDGSAWEVTAGTSKRSFSTKTRAVRAARRAARPSSGRVIVH